MLLMVRSTLPAALGVTEADADGLDESTPLTAAARIVAVLTSVLVCTTVTPTLFVLVASTILVDVDLPVLDPVPVMV